MMICVNSVCVNPGSITIPEGQWYYKATATVCPTNASCRSVTWHSDNTCVATVNASSGYIYAVAPGTANIYATATDGSNQSDYMTVTVIQAVKVDSVEMSVSVQKGYSFTLAASVSPENATNRVLAWSSDNTSVATVNNGVVCGVNYGTANITASATDGSGKKASYRVTVPGSKYATAVTVNPSRKTLFVGEKFDGLCATVYPYNAINKTVRWRSGNSSIATVNESTGVVTAQKTGSVNIYADAQDGSGKSGYCTITVRNPIKATNVIVQPKFQTIKPGETVSMNAWVRPDNADNKKVTWSTTDSRIANVSVTRGDVVGIKDGTVTITAKTDDGGFTDSGIVTVDSRARVTVEENGGYSRIVFPTGKVWNYINYDMVHYSDYADNKELQKRLYENTFNTIIEDPPFTYCRDPKTYTDDELILLYTLDPHGLAAYVQLYASRLTDTNDTPEQSVRKIVNYKDYVFSILFGRSPQYYARNTSGTWYETYNPSSILKVYSESEFLFGDHNLYDGKFTLDLITVVLDLISIGMAHPLLKGKAVQTGFSILSKLYSMGRAIGQSVIDADFKAFVTAIATDKIDEKTINEDLRYEYLNLPAGYRTKNYSLVWVTQLYSLASDMNALAETVSETPSYYKEAYMHCARELNYCVLIRTTRGQLVPMTDIYQAVKDID